MSEIQLNFINRSNSASNNHVVIFQKNLVAPFSELPVVWRSIPNCAIGDNYPFVFPVDIRMDISDAWGNFTPRLRAYPGQLFEVTNGPNGYVLTLSSTSASSPNEYQILNALPQGTVNAYCYRDGRACALIGEISPGQKAIFEFKPTIWIGFVSGVYEGEAINSAILSEINTEISLLGIERADIVLTGGGTGPTATPFAFSLENISWSRDTIKKRSIPDTSLPE